MRTFCTPFFPSHIVHFVPSNATPLSPVISPAHSPALSSPLYPRLIAGPSSFLSGPGMSARLYRDPMEEEKKMQIRHHVGKTNKRGKSRLGPREKKEETLLSFLSPSNSHGKEDEMCTASVAYGRKIG